MTEVIKIEIPENSDKESVINELEASLELRLDDLKVKFRNASDREEKITKASEVISLVDGILEEVRELEDDN